MCGRFEQHNIVDQTETSNQVKFVSMLQNWNYMYSNHYRFFTCIGLEPCHYDINLDDASSISVISDFRSMFQSNVLLV